MKTFVSTFLLLLSLHYVFSSTVTTALPLQSILPDAGIENITTLPDIDLSETERNLSSFSENVKNLRATTISISSSVLSAQAVHHNLSDVLAYMKAVRDGVTENVSEIFLSVEKVFRMALVEVTNVGIIFEKLLEVREGTERMMILVRTNIESLKDNLSSLPLLENLDLSEVIRNLSSFSFGSFDIPSTIENINQKAFTIIDDLTGEDLSVEKVLNILDLRGGFYLPVDLPAGFGQLVVQRESLSTHNVDLDVLGLNGIVSEKLGLSSSINFPENGLLNGSGLGLNAANDLQGSGFTDITKGGAAWVQNNLDLGGDVDLGKLGRLSGGFGESKMLQPQLNIVDLTGEVTGNKSFGGGGFIESSLINGSSGGFGNANLDAALDLKALQSHLALDKELGGGGNIKLGNDLLDISGGMGSDGSFLTNTDLKELTSSSKLLRSEGIGGKIQLGNGSLFGGAGSNLDISNAIDLRDRTFDFGSSRQSGTDGSLQLPGNLGGLTYDIDDLTTVSGHIDLKDLSSRSIEILKKTDILVTIDLPGDQLDDITLEAHPSIDTSKLGNLNVLSFAREFSEDVKSITDFNMLNEMNLLKALKSGTEFLYRLDIIDALRNEIGYITALPEVVANIKKVLADMDNIMATLNRLKTFAANVRALGEALLKFDVSQLSIELPELEALSLPTMPEDLLPINPEGLTDYVGGVAEDAATKVEEAVEQAIPDAAATLKDFSVGTFLDTAALVDKITSAASDIAVLQSTTNVGEVVRNAGTALGQGLGAIAAVNQMNNIIKDVTALAGSELDLNKVIDLANLNGLDLNDLSNLHQIMELLNLDSSFLTPLTNLIQIANIQDINLNELAELANLNDLNLNSIVDLSNVLNTDLSQLNLSDINLTAELSEILESGIGLPDGSALLPLLNVDDLDLQEIIEAAMSAELDINDIRNLEEIGELLNLDILALDELEKIISLANFNGIDLTKLPELADLADLDLKDIVDLRALLGNQEIGNALELLDIAKVAEALKGVTDGGDLKNLLEGLDLDGVNQAVEETVQNLANSGTGLSDAVESVKQLTGNTDLSAVVSDGLKRLAGSDVASGFAQTVNGLIKDAVAAGGRRLRSRKFKR